MIFITTLPFNILTSSLPNELIHLHSFCPGVYAILFSVKF